MLYTINKGLESEQWRKYVAGFAALVISAVMPVLSMLVFNTSDNPGKDVRGVSSAKKPADNDKDKQSADKAKDTSVANPPVTHDSPAASGATAADTSASAVSPAPYQAPAAGGTAQLSSAGTLTAPSYTTSGGGRGGGSTAAAPSGTNESTECDCSDSGSTLNPVTVEVDDVLGTQINPTSPLDSSINIDL